MSQRNKNPAEGRSPYLPAFRPRSQRETMWYDPSVVGIPDRVRTKLRYQMTTTATTTLGSLFSYQFRGNSVYDPDLTGAGAQPTYYDNFANMYNSYVVLSSKLWLEALNVAAAPVLVGAYPAYNTSIGSTALDCAAMRYAVSKSLYGAGNAVKGVLNLSMSTAQQFGVRPEAVVDDDGYSGSGGNPTSAATWYWTVFAQNETGTTTLNLTLRVYIEYDVIFFDPVVSNLSAARQLTPSGAPAASAASPAVVSSPVYALSAQLHSARAACSCGQVTGHACTGEFTPSTNR